ncbi:two pore domain potassium channel family protein [Cellulophaga sp. HaHa_2_95]|uniref:potassium channel family protein n=1 Tax=unclassified Cellulophaga TaxID=2634405 RepID=UPI001C4F1451|nr:MULTISPECIES: potassium channel family protein [unclassified Cellulophaga]QXP53080.1 two pore domain potassium channel family protein [Cellulophaga sp. HaHa_2_1]QXP54635.1 two pore domain potassium channel family protein [Cellulophaga sp. HaHa_2_95]
MELQSIPYWNKFISYKYLIALVAAFNFLLTPLHIALSGFSPAYVIVVNYTLVILSSSLIASNKSAKLVSYLIGIFTLVVIWLEFSNPNSRPILICRLVFSLLLFACFGIILIRQLLKIKQINLQFILGPLLGFLYLGIIGGILFEAIHLLDSNSFQLINGYSGFSFYYFSFISITTVGYGDITPLTAPAQSLTLVMNIIGQFYLAIVIGVFVGKYINTKSN